jgi:4'-phosphopantetheinyl transferase EntD
LDSPAKLSAELAALFPAGVVAAELTEPAPRTVLTAAEFQFIAHCAEKRIDDFTRGRACAQRALRELGIEGFSLLAGKDREPLWPDSIVGSITHTGGYAAAVVARGVDIEGIGLDCELIASVDEELWSRICTPAEQERLAQLPSVERGRQAALIFAAKEAFYKCQFPLTREWVGFEDVVIEPASAGSLRILPQKTLPLEASQVAALVSRFQFRDPWVIAGVTTAPYSVPARTQRMRL